jgi:hypothetical protein
MPTHRASNISLKPCINTLNMKYMRTRINSANSITFCNSVLTHCTRWIRIPNSRHFSGIWSQLYRCWANWHSFKKGRGQNLIQKICTIRAERAYSQTCAERAYSQIDTSEGMLTLRSRNRRRISPYNPPWLNGRRRSLNYRGSCLRDCTTVSLLITRINIISLMHLFMNVLEDIACCIELRMIIQKCWKMCMYFI